MSKQIKYGPRREPTNQTDAPARTHENAVRGWSRKSFEVDKFRRSTTTHQGYVLGPVGIHKCGNRHTTWTVTHLPSGLAVASLAKLQDAKRVGALLQYAFADDGVTINADMASRIKRRWQSFSRKR